MNTMRASTSLLFSSLRTAKRCPPSRIPNSAAVARNAISPFSAAAIGGARTMATTNKDPQTPLIDDFHLRKNAPESAESAANIPLKKLFTLDSRTVIITGGGRGLGITIAAAVMESGADVVCVDVLPVPTASEWTKIEQIAKRTGVKATYKQCDITSEAEISAMMKESAEVGDARKKPVRGMLNAAGIQQMRDAIDYPIEDFKRIMDVNVTGAYVISKHFAQLLRAQDADGSIVLIASMSGQITNRGIHCAAYNTSKSAVHQMCRSLAYEWGQHGIRVNTLSPGYIRTAMTDALLAEKPELEQQWMNGALLGRLGAPEDFIAPAIFLLAEGSAWMTGADLRVDGGHCASA